MAKSLKPPAMISRTISPEEDEKRRRALRRWAEFETEYEHGWRTSHEDVIDLIQPNHGQFLLTDTNRGSPKDEAVLNNYASDKAGKLTAAIDVGVCSEAREWWVAGAEDPRDSELAENREYFHDFQVAMFAFIAKIGWYAPNRNAIEDVVGPATGLVLIEEDKKNVARCTHVPVGQYRLGADAAGEVNAVVRRFTYTAAQMVEEFGEEKCSLAVRSAMRNHLTQVSKFTVLHLIEERAAIDREYGAVDAKNMAWSSIWLELGQGYTGSSVPGQGNQDLPAGPMGILRESGYNEQPFYVYRWNAIGQNAYGTDSPGWKGLQDVKSLQDIEYGSAEMLALLMKPPMNQPDELANASLLPDARNPIPSNSHVKFEPSYVIDHESITVTEAKSQRIEQRLNNTFFGDILFILSGNQNLEPKTAEEIRGIKEERLLQLGGVFARISSQLRIALKRMAAMAHRAGELPTPPPKLLERGRLKIEFVNPLVTAQKAIGFTGIQQLIALEIQLGEAKKAAGTGKLNGDEIMDTASDMLGVKTNILFSDEEMAKQRADQQAQVNAQQQAQAMPEAAASLKDLSNTDPEKLRSLLEKFGPNAQAQGASAGA